MHENVLRRWKQELERRPSEAFPDWKKNSEEQTGLQSWNERSGSYRQSDDLFIKEGRDPAITPSLIGLMSFRLGYSPTGCSSRAVPASPTAEEASSEVIRWREFFSPVSTPPNSWSHFRGARYFVITGLLTHLIREQWKAETMGLIVQNRNSAKHRWTAVRNAATRSFRTIEDHLFKSRAQ